MNRRTHPRPHDAVHALGYAAGQRAYGEAQAAYAAAIGAKRPPPPRVVDTWGRGERPHLTPRAV